MKVLPALLQLLMRHSSITTTVEFYVGRNAEQSADQFYVASSSFGQLGGVLGGSHLSATSSEPRSTPKSPKKLTG